MLTTILGMKWTGKTTLGYHLLCQHPKRVVIDGAGTFKKGDHLGTSLHQFLHFFERGQARPGVTLVYRPARDERNVRDLVWQFLADMRGWAILIDEADRFCTPQKMPLFLDNIVNMTEHYGLQVIVTARRAARLHRDITANADRLILFHSHEANDLEYLRKCTGQDYAKKLRNLQQGEHLDLAWPPQPENELTNAR